MKFGQTKQLTILVIGLTCAKWLRSVKEVAVASTTEHSPFFSLDFEYKIVKSQGVCFIEFIGLTHGQRQIRNSRNPMGVVVGSGEDQPVTDAMLAFIRFLWEDVLELPELIPPFITIASDDCGSFENSCAGRFWKHVLDWFHVMEAHITKGKAKARRDKKKIERRARAAAKPLS